MPFFNSGKRAQVRLSSLFLTALSLIVFQDYPHAQSPSNSSNSTFTQPRDRITEYVDDEQRITLAGNRHPLATAKNDRGAVSPGFHMDRMVLTLLPDAAQQSALEQLIDEQHDPESPHYHRWLTPEQFAQNFGVSETDAEQVVEWLELHGMDIEEITGGRRSIVFSGTAAQVEAAFHTQIHTYNVGGEMHHANADEPQIPAAFSGVVGGVVSLHDFTSKPMNIGARMPMPEFTSGGSYYLAPADLATIYDIGPVYQRSITGSGQSIAIVARSNINLSDVAQFRSAFGLQANNPQVIVNGSNPGILSSGEETEADLDVEWSGAVAKGATIKFVVSKSTSSTDGTYLSAQYIVTHNVAPILSMSFGLCEAQLGTTGNAFINNLWQQAAAQGITVFVSGGDSGAADCDSSSSSKATHGRAVNGLCSTPYSVCVGGTEFNDTSHPSLYWSSANNGQQGSALSYIPETAWNESTSGGLWASGGGVSMIYSKPLWQSGSGVPADGKRDVPDVSLTAAGHDGYLIYQNGGLYVVGGTSAAAPSFAGIMALLLQSEQARQGNANSVFYSLAAKQKAGGASVFHDTVLGSNSVPGQAGFNAGAGYDQATGLGSIDASVLINHWNDATAASGFHANASTNFVSIVPGSEVSMTVNITTGGASGEPVALTLRGLPIGISATISPAKFGTPGSSTVRFNAANNVKAGTYQMSISATSGGQSQQIPLSLVCSKTPGNRRY